MEMFVDSESDEMKVRLETTSMVKQPLLASTAAQLCDSVLFCINLAEGTFTSDQPEFLSVQ